MKPTIRSFVLKLLFLVAICALVAVFFFWDRLLSSAFERVSGTKISYSSWVGNPFGKSVISFPSLSVKNTGFGVISRELALSLDTSRLVKRRQIFIEGVLSDAFFSLEEKKGNSVNNILELVSSSKQTFSDVSFSVMCDWDVFNVTAFSAESTDIRIKGHFSINKKTNFAKVEVYISVSPLLVSGVGEEIKNRILAPEENGWYGTAIVYSGNPDFLRALYFAVSPDR